MHTLSALALDFRGSVFMQWRPQAAGRTALYLSQIRRSNDVSNNG